MLFVIPITEDDSVLVVVGVHLFLRVNEEGSSQPIDVLRLKENKANQRSATSFEG